MAQLQVRFGKKIERVLNLDVPVLRIGRNPDSDLVVDNEEVSRVHCQVLAEGDYHVVEDLQSSVGTFVNGQRILRKRLDHGDTVELGRTTLYYDAHTATMDLGMAGEIVQSNDILDDYWASDGSAQERSFAAGDIHAGDTPVPESAALMKDYRLAPQGPQLIEQKTMPATPDQLEQSRKALAARQDPHLLLQGLAGMERIPIRGASLTVGYTNQADYRVKGRALFAKDLFRIDLYEKRPAQLTPLSSRARVSIDGRQVDRPALLKDGSFIDANGKRFRFNRGV